MFPLEWGGAGTSGGRRPWLEWVDCEGVAAAHLLVLWLVAATPPLAEQEAIADRLDEDGEKREGAVVLVEEHLSRLREYRQALITAAVTGKIEVSDRRVYPC